MGKSFGAEKARYRCWPWFCYIVMNFRYFSQNHIPIQKIFFVELFIVQRACTSFVIGGEKYWDDWFWDHL